MKKIIIFSVVILALLFAFAGCSKDNSDEATTESTYPWENDNWQQTELPSDNYNDSTLNQNSQNENQSANNNSNNFTGNDYNNQSNTSDIIDNSNNSQNSNNQNSNNIQNNNSGSSGNSNPLISDEDMSKLENSNAEVYFTDNPNNPSIVAISQRYGVPKENLVALIKVNAEFPTVTILEFSGARDANGELVMTYEEFQNIYEINETNGSIVKASKNGMNNDGLSFVEAKIYVTLAKEYFIPELPNLKVNKRYPD